MGELEDRVAFVIGASQWIGKEITWFLPKMIPMWLLLKFPTKCTCNVL
ncbi:MAG: hypothetical protein P8Y18_04925 [Candidatus Bathyarchaeota archaeon]